MHGIIHINARGKKNFIIIMERLFAFKIRPTMNSMFF